jgi:hypothetical protein
VKNYCEDCTHRIGNVVMDPPSQWLCEVKFHKVVDTYLKRPSPPCKMSCMEARESLDAASIADCGQWEEDR